MSDREPDHNPFAAPGAELERAAPRGGRVGWKLYLWAMVALLALIYALLGVAWMQPLDALDAVITGASLAGLFGFAYRRSIAIPGFWRAWLPIQVLWDLALTLVLTPAGLAYRFSDSEASSTPSLGDLSGLLLILPLYAALYLYGHRSPELWPA